MEAEGSNQEDKMVCVGVFSTPHGVRGAVKVRVFAEDHDAFLAYPLYAKPLGDKPFVPDFLGYTEGGVILRVPGIDSREAARVLKGCRIYAPRSAFPKCEEGAYYIEDLKGLNVTTEKGAPYGKVLDAVDYGAGPSLEIEKTNGKTVFLPFNDDVFPVVNISEGFLHVSPPEEFDGDVTSSEPTEDETAHSSVTSEAALDASRPE